MTASDLIQLGASERIATALDYIIQNPPRKRCDFALAHCLDQVVRKLCGTDQEYQRFLKAYQYNSSDPSNPYQWDTGDGETTNKAFA